MIKQDTKNDIQTDLYKRWLDSDQRRLSMSYERWLENVVEDAEANAKFAERQEVIKSSDYLDNHVYKEVPESMRAAIRYAVVELRLWAQLGPTKHVDCPCWVTGEFKQAPCPWHDGKDAYPVGSWAKALKTVQAVLFAEAAGEKRGGS
jgi:hypothetical protein